MAPNVLKENSQIPVLSISQKFFYLFIALLSFFYNRVEIDVKGRIITIIQSLVFETSFSCKSFSESKISRFLLQSFLIHLLQSLKSLILKIDVRITEKVLQPTGFPGGVAVQNPSANVGDMTVRFDPWVKASLEEGMASPSNMPACGIS